VSRVAKPVVWGPGRPFDVQGHRGARGLRPENTLAGIAYALEVGVGSIEIDVALSVDEAVVLTHYGAVPHPVAREAAAEDAGASSPVPVRTLPLAELRRLDLGEWGRPERGDVEAFRAEPGQRMTTLGAVLALFELFDAKDVRLDVEIKSARHSDPHWDAAHVVSRTIAEIRAHGALEMCSLRSFDMHVQHEGMRQCPELARVLLVGTLSDRVPPDLALDPSRAPEEILDMAEAISAAAIAPGRSMASPGLVSLAHDHRLPVIPWTINDPGTIDDMLALGVDGICTDRPDLVRAAAAEAGFPLPVRHRAPDWLGYGWQPGPEVAAESSP
jgi:glycerophosphoryl diester phosphodiesterase